MAGKRVIQFTGDAPKIGHPVGTGTRKPRPPRGFNPNQTAPIKPPRRRRRRKRPVNPLRRLLAVRQNP